jgi:hypothetical protein
VALQKVQTGSEVVFLNSVSEISRSSGSSSSLSGSVLSMPVVVHGWTGAGKPPPTGAGSTEAGGSETAAGSETGEAKVGGGTETNGGTEAGVRDTEVPRDSEIPDVEHAEMLVDSEIEVATGSETAEASPSFEGKAYKLLKSPVMGVERREKEEEGAEGNR